MKKINTKVLAYAGVLIAMNVVLVRVVAIPIGPTLRITVGNVPIVLASFWFGPVVGAVCGGLGDLIGCILSGYAPIPLLLVSSILTGFLPYFFKKFVVKAIASRDKKAGMYGKGFVRMLIMMAVVNLITSQGISTLGLAIWQGIGFLEMFILRLPQNILLTITNSILVLLLYASPATSFVVNSTHSMIFESAGSKLRKV